MKLRSRLGAGVVISTAAVLLASLTGLSSVGAAARAKSTLQLGIDTFVTDQCQSSTAWASLATQQFSAFKAIGANSVGLTIPLYMSSIKSNAVVANDECNGPQYTPSPARLGVLIGIAHSLGLHVLVRPVIDESSFRSTPGAWRGVIAPTNVNDWFNSYLHTLAPYLQIAQQDHAEHFALSTELDSLTSKPEWRSIISVSKAVYKGDLSFDILWQTNVKQKTFSGTTPALDAYQWISGATKTTPTWKLLKSWNKALSGAAKLSYSPSLATIQEIGILAQDGAYSEPYEWSLPLASHPFNQTIQARWFTMGCEFVKDNKMKGIYYWGSYFNTGANAIPTKPNPEAPESIQPQSVAAIKSCFTGK